MLSDTDQVTKSVLLESEIESSSDFIVAAYTICSRVDREMMLKIDPVYRWEYNNWHDLWESNVNFITRKLNKLDTQDYVEVGQAYTDILKYFLENEVISKIYKMDTQDHIGWKIYKELTEKRNFCIKMFNIESTKE